MEWFIHPKHPGVLKINLSSVASKQIKEDTDKYQDLCSITDHTKIDIQVTRLTYIMVFNWIKIFIDVLKVWNAHSNIQEKTYHNFKLHMHRVNNILLDEKSMLWGYKTPSYIEKTTHPCHAHPNLHQRKWLPASNGILMMMEMSQRLE